MSALSKPALAVGAVLFYALSLWWAHGEGKRHAYAESKATFAEYQQKEAALAAENLREVLEREREERSRADTLETAYHDKEKEIRVLRRANGALSARLGGLRDPYAGAGNSGEVGAPDPTAARASTGTPAGGHLSSEASRFLLDFAEEADRAAAYAGTCYEYINGLK